MESQSPKKRVLSRANNKKIATFHDKRSQSPKKRVLSRVALLRSHEEKGGLNPLKSGSYPEARKNGQHRFIKSPSQSPKKRVLSRALIGYTALLLGLNPLKSGSYPEIKVSAYVFLKPVGSQSPKKRVLSRGLPP